MLGANSVQRNSCTLKKSIDYSHSVESEKFFCDRIRHDRAEAVEPNT